MQQFETVSYRYDNTIALISLNRPKVLNAFNLQLRDELQQVLAIVNANTAIKIVILTGEGKAFCAGADVEEGMNNPVDDVEAQLLLEYKPIIMSIDNSDKLYIAAINGACAGIGSAVAMVCDLAVMADNAYFYSAFSAIGLVPDGGISYHLLQHLGYKKALQLIIEAGKINAEQAFDYGMVNKIVNADDLVDSAHSWAKSLAVGPTVVQQHAKSILKQATNSNLSDVFNLEAKAQKICAKTDDAASAITAFMNKETPVFKGK